MVDNQTFDQENEEQNFINSFDRSRFNSFYAYSAHHKWGSKFEAAFWEWMAKPIIKYDKDGNVIRRESKEGPIYQWLNAPFSKKTNKFISSIIMGTILFSINLWIISSII